MDLRIFNCRAQWITMADDLTPAPHFRKEFELAHDAEKVVCKVSGLGSYILSVDGKRSVDSILEPRFSNYNKSVYYNIIELEPLEKGRHTIGIMLGRSRRAMITGNTWGWHNPPWDKKRQLVFQMDIYYGNGTFACIRSDETWKYNYGPVRFDCLYAGERHDERFCLPDWDTPGFDDSSWENAVCAPEPEGILVHQESPPIAPIRIIEPVSVTKTGAGSTLYSFSENVAGNAIIKAKGSDGSGYTVKYAEKLNEDMTVDKKYKPVYEALQEDSFTFGKNSESVFEPIFTYKGFRYMEIEQDDDIEILDVKGVVYHNRLESNGNFSCSSEMLNKLHENSLRALLSNLHHTPTDTPIYEKNGWTGDAQLTSLTALYNFNIRKLYGTWLNDFSDSQQANGEIPPIIPSPGWGYSSSDFGWIDAKPALPAWDAAYFEILMNLHTFYGCPDLIEKHFENLVKYMEYLSSCSENHIVVTGLGDWLAPSGEDHSIPLLQPNENHLTSTAYYFRMSRQLSGFAAILGKDEHASHYNDLASRISKAFNEKYLDKSTGVYSSCPGMPFRQTPNVLALAFGLVPEDIIEKTAKALVHDIEMTRDGHLWTGLLGTTYILGVLCENGYADLAYKIAVNDTYPSWGYWIKNGATAMYESWELDSRSRNHHMYGTIDSWFYKYICGICPASPGFKKIMIKPYFPAGLEWAKADHHTASGDISVKWHRIDKKISIDMEVPPGVEAVFCNTTAGGKTVPLSVGNNSIIL